MGGSYWLLAVSSSKPQRTQRTQSKRTTLRIVIPSGADRSRGTMPLPLSVRFRLLAACLQFLKILSVPLCLCGEVVLAESGSEAQSSNGPMAELHWLDQKIPGGEQGGGDIAALENDALDAYSRVVTSVAARG